MVLTYAKGCGKAAPGGYPGGYGGKGGKGDFSSLRQGNVLRDVLRDLAKGKGKFYGKGGGGYGDAKGGYGNPYAGYGSYGGGAKGGKVMMPDGSFYMESSSAKGGKVEQKAAPPTSPPVPVTYISLAEESTITAEGLPADAPVVAFQKGSLLFSYANALLRDLLVASLPQGQAKSFLEEGGIDGQVEVVHDPDWETYPEVARAVKAEGLEENCIAVAFCKEHKKWGIGLGTNWKARENSSRLALSVALALDCPGLPGLLRNHPDFDHMLGAANLAPGATSRIAKQQAKKKKKWSAVQGQVVEDLGHSAAPVAANSSELPTVAFVDLKEEESTVTAQGMPSSAPVIIFDKYYNGFFKDGQGALSEILDDIETEVVFTHDADWTEFPEIGTAVTEAFPGGEAQDQGFCVASCAAFNKWGLGLASGWKNREMAAKLALAVAICAEGGATLDSAAAAHPKFGKLCAASGFVADPEAVAVLQAEEPPAKKSKKEEPEPEVLGLGESAPEEAALGEPLPQNKPFWLRLPAVPAALVDSMPTNTLVFVTDDGGERKPLLGKADSILAHFAEDHESVVEYVDDPEWVNFPETLAGFEGFNVKDECLHIAVCGVHNVWAASTGRKWKTRNNAAKIALAAVLALKIADSGEAPDVSAFEEFSEFLEESAAVA